MLPQNFDDEIASTLKNYRYRRNVDEVESDKERDKNANRDKEEIELDKETRKLRSGRVFNVRLETLPERFKEKVISCTRRWLCIPRVHVAKVEERLKLSHWPIKS